MSNREIVRNMGSERTHLADVAEAYQYPAEAFGATYRRPGYATKALCGVAIKDGVIMQEGTKLLCPTCRHLGQVDEILAKAASQPGAKAVTIEDAAWRMPDTISFEIESVVTRLVKQARDIEDSQVRAVLKAAYDAGYVAADGGQNPDFDAFLKRLIASADQ